MRLLLSICLLFYPAGLNFSQPAQPSSLQDTISTGGIHENSFVVNYRALPLFARYEKRYRIISNYNDDYHNIDINYSLQNFISAEGYSDSSILSSYRFMNESNPPIHSDIVGNKEVFYGAWRNRVTHSGSEEEIIKYMNEGTQSMIESGFSDLAKDFLPFITGLMEEQHIVNYDNSRTKAFGRGSRGIVTSLEILNALGAQNTELNYGVCRDVHEMGRLLLKTMAETWYGHFHPGVKTDFNDYIFLQSWTTNKSQHVTISFVDPLDTKRVYELDWGRVIERMNIAGYDNGRMYGNTYRIWKFDNKKQVTAPVDFRRTAFGKILDEKILTREEYLQFNGIYDEEFYSDISFDHDMGRYGGLTFSLGGYNPDQHYFLAGWSLETKNRNLTSFLNHATVIGIQGVIHEDTRKKELLYPQVAWGFAGSVMGIPRIISKFSTTDFIPGRKLSLSAFLNQQFDIFLTGNSFYVNDSIDKNDLSGSGDGNLSFSNGVSLVYKPGNKLYSSFSIQARSCLLPKDIRLFTPNVFTLIPSLRLVTPAIDVIASGVYRFNQTGTVSSDGMIEFTNLGGILLSGSSSAGFSFSEDNRFIIGAGITEQVKGVHYFWYPVSRGWIDFRLDIHKNSLALSILKYPENSVSVNISYRRHLK